MQIIKNESFGYDLTKGLQHKCEQCKGEFLLYHYIYEQMGDKSLLKLQEARESGVFKVKAICPACGCEQKNLVELKISKVKETLNTHFYLEKA